MGNNPSDFESQFKQNYSFIQILDDTNFGMVRIYRKRQINFDYVMVYDQSLSDCPTSDRNKKIEELTYVRDNPHDQVLRLFHFEEIQKNSFECKVDVIRMYIEYYNFTLENLIQNNARGRIVLDYDQILYIINSIISVYLYFDKIKANWFRIDQTQIFISTSGCVYFSPTQICRSLGDQVNGCITKSTTSQKIATLQPNDAFRSYEKLKALMYCLIEHHSLISLQQFQRLRLILDSANTIKGVAGKIPKTTRTEIDMQKQIYRSDDSSSSKSNKSTKRGDISNSTTNRSMIFIDEKTQRFKY